MSKYPLIEKCGLKVMESHGFKQVAGFPSYFVNKDGIVVSFKITVLKHKKARRPNGKVVYPTVGLHKNGKFHLRKAVHKLVAEAFLGPCPPGLECCHLDGDPKNTNVENLKYVSRKENHSHKILHGTAQRGEKHPCAKLSQKDVASIKKEYWFDGKNAGNARQLAKRFGVSKSTIVNVATGKKWKHLLERGK